jgi:hypothetical protein
MTPKNWLELIAGSFATGALGWLATHASTTPPSNAAQWEALGFGVLIGGLIGVRQLFTPKPGGLDAAKAKTDAAVVQ